MKTGAAFARGRSKQDYCTPPELIKAVVSRFGLLHFDLAATYENTVAPRFFGPPEIKLVMPIPGGIRCVAADAFACDWTSLRGNLWLNPPFDRIAPWAQRCAATISFLNYNRIGHQTKILFLVPAAVGSNWWRDHVHDWAHVLFLNGRVCFDGVAPYPKDCTLCVYGEKPGYDIWPWGRS